MELIPKEERKPNAALLLNICRRESVLPREAIYVGDSLTRDISMAKSAGITVVWAKYGIKYDPMLWNLLVQITHSSDEDVRREEILKREYGSVQPDFAIETFADMLRLCGAE